MSIKEITNAVSKLVPATTRGVAATLGAFAEYAEGFEADSKSFNKIAQGRAGLVDIYVDAALNKAEDLAEDGDEEAILAGILRFDASVAKLDAGVDIKPARVKRTKAE